MHKYDYIITGTGCAGLSLAYQFCQSEWGKRQKILLLDRRPKDQNDRTWCYWSSEAPTYQSAQKFSWDQLEFFSKDDYQVQSIAPYQYICIRGIDFYEEVSQVIRLNPNVDWRIEKVTSLENQSQGAKVYTDQGSYQAKMVFNSIPLNQKPIPSDSLFIRQHFYGFFIETEKDVFDDLKVRLMDFRVPSEKDVRFFYILPFSPNKALVEFTVFSDTVFKTETYQKHIESYIAQQLGIEKYQITEQERGIIPMTDFAFPRHQGKHILNMGTVGGMTKPTTGYTFKNIQRDALQIVQSLRQNQLHYFNPQKSRRFRFYDRLLLYLMKNEPHTIEAIMRSLFLSNDHRRVLKFLDEKTYLYEEAQIFLHLPWMPFLRSLYQVHIQKSISHALSKIWPRKLVHSPSNS